MGRENGRGIYELVADEPSSGLQALFVTSTATSSLLWHRRLGHPCFDKLKKTLPCLSLTQFVCELCQLGKHHRSSYSSHDGIPSSTPFDLLHCDVWGPSRTPFILGHRYYIVFVDDYTRVSWVYLLCDHSKVVTTFTHFFTEVVTPYSTTPKILRTDNTLEFAKPLYVPFVLIVALFTKPLVLTPHNKMASQSENTVNSLISLAHYSLRCMSHLIFHLTPS